jgi:LAO/AO transport system kinase
MATVDRGDVPALFDAARAGDRAAVARLLSVIERGGGPARELGRLSYPLAGGGYTVGITGAPGAGKSTLTSALVGVARAKVESIGVLAVDPSSPFTGGAILGDRVRMQDHALDEGVFIRSMATRGHLGGLALATPEAVRLLEATGRQVILVETVGVGQVEVDIAEAADTTVVVVNPGWGDAVQASKAGLMEIADVFAINKADRPGVDDTRRDLEAMLDLSPGGRWRPPIVATVASRGEGVEQLWEAIVAHRAHLEASGELARRRQARQDDELRHILREKLDARARALEHSDGFGAVRARLHARQIDPWAAADEVLAGS